MSQFSDDAVNRIKRTVKTVEGWDAPADTNPRQRSYPTKRVKVRVVGLKDDDIPGIYKGFLIDCNNSTDPNWSEPDDFGTAITGGDNWITIWNAAEWNNNITELATSGHVANSITRLQAGYIECFGDLLSIKRDPEADPPLEPIVVINIRPRQADYVWLIRSGGSAGTSSTDCTFTYDVYTGDSAHIGNLIVEDAVPLRRRWPNTIYKSNYDDGGGEDFGFGIWQGATFMLLDVLTEYPDYVDC